MVRAKFLVSEVRQIARYGPHVQDAITLTAVSGPGNEQWSRWTPSGSITMTITNPDALNQFRIGKHVYVDFTEADE